MHIVSGGPEGVGWPSLLKPGDHKLVPDAGHGAPGSGLTILESGLALIREFPCPGSSL